MATQSNYERLLEHGVEELRRLHDAISTSFEALKTKALALLAGEVAIVTFLFSADSSTPLALDRMYSEVFWGIGILLLVIAFLLLLSVIAPVLWHHPPETKDLRDMKGRFNENPAEFLEYLKDEYTTSISMGIEQHRIRKQRLLLAIIAISAGIFLIALLKFGSGPAILG